MRIVPGVSGLCKIPMFHIQMYWYITKDWCYNWRIARTVHSAWSLHNVEHESQTAAAASAWDAVQPGHG